MRQSRTSRLPGVLAIVLCLLNISGTPSEPRAPVHVFVIDFELDKEAPKLLRKGLMARDFSRKLEGKSASGMKFTAREEDNEEPCGKDPNCDLVTVQVSADESEQGGVAIVLTVVQAKVPKRHKTRVYPLDDVPHACDYPPASRQSWNKCIDAYSDVMFTELDRHILDDHQAAAP